MASKIRRAASAVAVTIQGVGPGVIAYLPTSGPLTGWLKANGAAISRTTYSDLFAVISTMYGTGDGSTTFNVPDIRGEFIRVWDDSKGINSGRNIGSWEDQAFLSHVHSPGNAAHQFILNTYPGTSAWTVTGTVGNVNMNGGNVTAATGGSETRPRNTAFLAMIKF
jgi:phage-related tail fiber protein